VAGYVALMTDRYPPFSLDQGGHEPGGPPISSAAPLPRDRRAGWTAGRAVALVMGSVLVVGGLGLAAGGATLVVADQVARDADGFMMSSRDRLATDGFAITSEDAQVQTAGAPDQLPEVLVGDVRVSAEAAGDTDLFVGVASAADARAYLGDVRHDTVLDFPDGDPAYRATEGGAPETPPTEQDFWVARATGTDPTLTWSLDDGDWTVVVMNADGSDAVSADVSAGAEVPWVATVIAVLFVLAGLALLVGALLIAIAMRAAARPAPPAQPSAPGSTP
jgi:hypothetical protein